MHNFIGIQNKTDNFRKGVFVDPFDEPVFLTFALDFRFEEVPAPSPEAMLKQSPLFATENGAISFLNNRGYADHGNSLKVFKEILTYITFQTPWYFQSITGINTLWKNALDIEGGNKSKGATIKIETLEAVDLRITELAALYRNTVYDKYHMRERVPDNLRWFSMDIYVAEARNLRFRIPGIGQNIAGALGVNTAAVSNIGGSILNGAQAVSGLSRSLGAPLGGDEQLSSILNQYGFVKFKCRQCEFDFSESFAGGASLNVALSGAKPSTNSFSIKVGFFEEEHKYADGSRLFDDLTKSSNVNNPWKLKNVGTGIQNAGSFLSGLPVVGGSLINAGQSVQGALSSIGGFINPALGAASSFISPSPENLGNVYGN
jgi:hypothetical protein